MTSNTSNHLHSSDRMAFPFVSVVIPAYNEERHIPTTFEALAAQQYPKDRFEIVLVDNGSTDETAHLANSYEDRIAIRVVPKAGGTIADVRNFGAAHSRGDLLAFLDCDCTVGERWLRQGVSFGATDLLWGAHYRAPLDSTWVAKIWEDFQATEIAGQASFIPSSNLWIFKNSFESLGGFSNAQETSEDVELGQRAYRHGFRVEAFPELSVVHRGSPETLKQFFLQNRWHGKHVLRMFLQNLPQLTYLPLLILSVYTLVLCFATVAGLMLTVVYHRTAFFLFPASLLLLPAFMLAAIRALRRGRPFAFPQLFVLYGTYLLARALALLQPPSRSHR